MWGVPPTLKGFFPGDDQQDPDVFNLVALAVNPNTTTDLLWQNQGSTGPITPTNFTLVLKVIALVNASGSAGKFTIYALNTVAASSAFTPVAEYYLAAGSAELYSNEHLHVVAPPNCKFQVLTTVTGDVVATARYIKGAGL
jgi:hypothetical protein